MQKIKFISFMNYILIKLYIKYIKLEFILNKIINYHLLFDHQKCLLQDQYLNQLIQL